MGRDVIQLQKIIKGFSEEVVFAMGYKSWECKEDVPWKEKSGSVMMVGAVFRA